MYSYGGSVLPPQALLQAFQTDPTEMPFIYVLGIVLSKNKNTFAVTYS